MSRNLTFVDYLMISSQNMDGFFSLSLSISSAVKTSMVFILGVIVRNQYDYVIRINLNFKTIIT